MMDLLCFHLEVFLFLELDRLQHEQPDTKSIGSVSFFPAGRWNEQVQLEDDA